ncbi:hypothetical protein MJO28_013247, partial [Puccinia striiformis f. sp. tritici]
NPLTSDHTVPLDQLPEPELRLLLPDTSLNPTTRPMTITWKQASKPRGNNENHPTTVAGPSAQKDTGSGEVQLASGRFGPLAHSEAHPSKFKPSESFRCACKFLRSSISQGRVGQLIAIAFAFASTYESFTLSSSTISLKNRTGKAFAQPMQLVQTT